MLFSFTRNRPGDSPRIAFFAKSIEHIRQFIFRQLIHQIRGRLRLSSIYAHIERALGLKTEPARRVIQLHRRYAQVEENPVKYASAKVLSLLREIAIARMNQMRARAPATQPLTTHDKGPLIPVQPQKHGIRPGPLQERIGMPSEAHCAIEIAATRLGNQPVQHLRKKNRNVRLLLFIFQ